MPDWSCVEGNTLLIPSGSSGHHLFVILNNPADFDGYLNSSLLVSISTIRAKYDDTLILNTGDHEFIKQPSYVVYRHTRIERAEDIYRGVEKGFFIPRKPFTRELLSKIRSGLFKSGFTPKVFKEIQI